MLQGSKIAALRRQSAGFTLLEMLVVLVIIGLLAGLVGPRLFGKVESSKIKTAEAQIKMIKGAIETMHLDIGRYPTKEEGLRMLNHKPQDAYSAKLWQGPYLDEDAPLDPWGSPYQYEPANQGDRPYFLYSLGADRTVGGADAAADIGYLPQNG